MYTTALRGLEGRIGGAFATLVFAAAVAVLSWSLRAPGTAAPLTASAHPAALPRVLTTDFSFDANVGQAPAAVRYLARSAGAEVLVFDDGISLRHRRDDGSERHATLDFVGARPGSVVPREPTAARTHRIVGRDASAWKRDLPRYGQLRRSDLYPGIDLIHFGRGADYEFDLVVHPGADPSSIRMKVAAPALPLVDAEGNLQLDGPDGPLHLKAPIAYQAIDGQRRSRPARWHIAADGSVGFDVPGYDRQRPLVIDPVFKLLYSSYLGGVHDDEVGAMVLDAQGSAYVVGNSGSEDWPVSGNAVQSTRKNLGSYVRNVVVTKFDAAGTLLWSTFLGGSVNDYGRSIAIDSKGQVVVTGLTNSPDFPTTADAMQRTAAAASSAFVAVLSPDGSTLAHSTFYGGSGGSEGSVLNVDGGGRLWLAGAAGSGLPTTNGSYKPTFSGSGNAGFVARFSPPSDGPLRLQAATYVGIDNPPADRFYTGNNVLGMAVAPDGSAWITGQVRHEFLPTAGTPLMPKPTATDHAAQIGALPLCAFAYVARLSPALDALPYASYLTGSTRESRDRASCAEYGRGIALDAAGDVVVAGSTSSDRFPTTPGALQASYPGAGGTIGHVGFATRFHADGSAIVWSTYVGSNGGDSFVNGLSLDAAGGDAWVYAASSGGANFPLSADALQPAHGGGTYDASVVQLDLATGALRYGTFMGGAGNDNAMAAIASPTGGLVVAGTSDSRNFAVTANALQSAYTTPSYDGGDWFLRVLGSGAISRVLPASGGNAGDVTLRLSGAGFLPDAVCALGGNGVTLASTGSSVAADGTSIECIFALAGAPTGAYDVSVINADNTRVTRPAAFTVAAGTGSDVDVDVIGRSTLRIGTPAVFDVVVTNQGDADAIGVFLFVRWSAGLQPVDPTAPDPFGLGLIPAVAAFPKDTTDFSRRSVVMPSAGVAGQSLVPLYVPVVRAGQSERFSFSLVASGSGDDEYVEAEVTAPMADADAAIASSRALAAVRAGLLSAAAHGSHAMPLKGGLNSDECRKALWDFVWDKASSKIPGVDCLHDFERAVFELRRYQLTHPGNRASLLGDILTSGFKSATDCVELAGIELAAAVEAAKRMLDLLNDAEAAAKIADACKEDDKNPKDKKRNKKKRKPTKPKTAIDPNDKSGPVGDGSAAHYVNVLQPMTYQVAFENLKTAALPAATVVVTDQLDPAKFDLSTLTLGDITWGSARIAVPPGVHTYSAVQSIDATMSVRVQGSLNPDTGVLRWTFTTLDPTTRLPPSDPTLGFLPPNVDGIQGQAYVNFTVMPKSGLAEGTRWENTARIVFDANAPIDTPTWVNTLDTLPPVSHVVSAEAQANGVDIDLAWSATDAGAGATRYTVYVSEDGGDFTAWQSELASISATYPGALGHRYGFFVVATDAAGNREALKSAAEAAVSLDSGSNSGGGGCTVGGPGQRDASLVMLLLAAALGLWRRCLRRPAAKRPCTAVD